jgi:hypothetical protein
MNQFEVEILSFEAINELPGSWSDDDYLALLSKMDYENPEEIKTSELKEMCMMSLTDFEPNEAAEITLDFLAADVLSRGQIENLAHQMVTEKLWEENPKLELHKMFFKATQLLHDAFNGTFPRTEAVQFQIRIIGDTLIFEGNPYPVIVRILAQGMSDRSLVNRLFGDQLQGTKFEEARDMIWELNEIESSSEAITYNIISSSYWFDDIKYADKYTASSHADSVTDDE